MAYLLCYLLDLGIYYNGDACVLPCDLSRCLIDAVFFMVLSVQFCSVNNQACNKDRFTDQSLCFNVLHQALLAIKISLHIKVCDSVCRTQHSFDGSHVEPVKLESKKIHTTAFSPEHTNCSFMNESCLHACGGIGWQWITRRMDDANHACPAAHFLLVDLYIDLGLVHCNLLMLQPLVGICSFRVQSGACLFNPVAVHSYMPGRVESAHRYTCCFFKCYHVFHLGRKYL